MADRIQQRRDTAANWTQYNPVLLDGEIGIEKDTDQWKMGDGIHPWSQLPYRGGELVQQKGQSTTVAMSQKATTDALGEKVTIPSFKISENDTYNRLIKELYLLNVDPSKYYFIYQCRYTHYVDETPDRVQFYIYWNDTDTFPTLDTAHFVCNYDVQYSGHTNGLIGLKNAQGVVVGYAVVEFTPDDGNEIYRKALNRDVISKLDYNPYIRTTFIKQLDLLQIENNLSLVNLKLSDIEGADDILPPQSEWINGYVVNESGELETNQFTTSFATTPLIEVSPNDIIILAFVRGYYLLGAVLYDENEDVIEVIYGTVDGSRPSENLDIPYTFIVKSGAKYIRYNIVANSLFPWNSQSIIRIKNSSISYLYQFVNIKDSELLNKINTVDSKKVNIPIFKITENDTYNRLIKELYLLNVDPSKYYFIYQCRYTHYVDETPDRVQFYIFANTTPTPPPTTGEYLVGLYDVLASGHTNGLVELKKDGVTTAYAVLDTNIDEGQNNLYNKLINIDVAKDLNFSPAISAYLKKNQLDAEINDLENQIVGVVSLDEKVPVNKHILTEYPDLHIEINDYNVWIRTSYDSENDILIRLRKINPNNNSINFSGVFIGPKTLTNSQLNVDEYLFHDALDSNPPIPTLNYGYLGGNHGLYTLKVYATGKTKADIGSLYHSSDCGDFILADVDNVNGVMWLHSVVKRDSTHPYPYRDWNMGRTPSSSTFTYVSGGVTTTNIVASSMVVNNNCQYPVPTTKKTCLVFELDGEVISNGEYTGKHLVIYEDYNIIDPETITYYPTMASQPLAKYHLIYEFIGSSCTFHADLEAVQDTYLSYFAPIQPVGLQNKGTQKGLFLMPKMNNYKTPILTDNVNVVGGTEYRNAETLVDVNMLPDRAIWGRTNDANDLIHFVNAYASGTSLIHGDGINNIRSKNIPVGSSIHNLTKPTNTWCKVYFKQVNNSVLKAGKHINWLAYFTYFKPGDNYLMYDVFESDIRVTYIHFTTQVTNLNISKNFAGLPTVIESSFNDFSIESDKVVISSANNGDYLVIANIL